MNIQKLGHCCLVVKEKGLTIMTDPGSYTTAQNSVKEVDVILVTHEHPDHLHIDSLKQVIKNNLAVRIITNTSVGNIIDKEGIVHEIVEDGQSVTISGVLIEGAGMIHADIYPEIVPVQNTGYFIGTRLFYPGDALYDPERPVDILALPVSGPWMKISEAIDYAIALHPKLAFPVHDGMLKFPGPNHALPGRFLGATGIEFKVLEEGKQYEV